ncbi:MAG: hypothetical protein PCFJNLEI_02945 [Verrucomicrobiae bacterium]|nr:hypothetical protein [Verrucomicrobiae bacterium]
MTVVDCGPERLTILPDKIEVTLAELQVSGNPFEQLLGRIQTNRTSESLFVLVRPNSAKMYRQLRSLMGQRRIEVVYEPVDADFQGEWRELIRPKPVLPPVKFPPPVARSFPEDRELDRAQFAPDRAALLAELSAKRSRVRDFEATGIEFSRYHDTEISVAYLAAENLSRVERPASSLRGATFVDPTAMWETRGNVLIKFPTKSAIHHASLSNLVNFFGDDTNCTVKTAGPWVVVERQWMTGGTGGKLPLIESPDYVRRMADLEAAMAEVRQKRGLPPVATNQFRKMTGQLLTNRPPRLVTQRDWIHRENSLCYRHELLDEQGRTSSGWRLDVVRLNVGLQAAALRPVLHGKQIYDPAEKPTAELLEAMIDAHKIPELPMVPRVGVGGAPPLPPKPALVFECRAGEVFVVNQEGLAEQALAAKGTVKVVGDEYYEVEPAAVLVRVLSLIPRAGVTGEPVAKLAEANGKYRQTLNRADPRQQSISFLVRDDSFMAYRQARAVAEQAGFRTNWELLGTNEPLRFGLKNQ